MNLNDYKYDLPLAEASTLPSRWYLDPQIYDLEKENIFRRGWHIVGNTHRLREPGDFITLDFFDEPLILIKDQSSRLRAFSNVCRHRAGRLKEGCGKAAALQCRYHGWTYNLDGKLKGAPEFDGVLNWNKEDMGLPEFAVKTWGPFVFINLEENPKPLEDALQGISNKILEQNFNLNEYQYLYRKDYSVNCNWKVYVDNYQEGYHIPIAHPKLNKEIDYSSYQVVNHDTYSQHFSTMKREAQKSTALWFLAFPDMMLNVYPDNMTLNIVIPIDHEQTKVVFEWYVHPRSPLFGSPPQENLEDHELSKELKDLISFSDLVQIEDEALCHDVQKGLKSKTYDQGRLSVKRENGVFWFHQKVAKALQQTNQKEHCIDPRKS